MFSRASDFVITGGTFNAASVSPSKRGIDVLIDWVSTDAFHNSKELYDAPKCHPHTRVAVLADIMKWVIESEAEGKWIMWLFGPAGAGKSAIAKRIAEIAEEKGLLIGSFFFSRTSSTRSNQHYLIATLAYQMALSIPGTRTQIEDAIERDPTIFAKNLQTQIDILLIKPFQSASTEIPFPKLIIIDGLDECSDSKAQVSILDAISHAFTKYKLPLTCLIVSRPETDLVTSFNGKEPLKSIHRRLALDDTYLPDEDIRRFFSDKFEEIRGTHRLRSTIPMFWPTGKSLDVLVWKSSGQFIFAATVVRFVESNRHRPTERLNIILGISPPGTQATINPFTELDAIYKQIFSSVEDIRLTLHVLKFYISNSDLANRLGKMSERFLVLEEGDIDRALIDLSSIISYDESSGGVNILHASLFDFLSDKHRSDEFYIDMASARTDFACRTLQYIKGPDGIQAGDIDIFEAGICSGGWILNSQLRNEILNFDLDAFIVMAAMKSPHWARSDAIRYTFNTWMDFIPQLGLEDADEELVIRRCKNSFELRIQKYQSDWRLQLLLTFACVTYFGHSLLLKEEVPAYRRLDILLDMHNCDIHLVDQHAFDLRYSEGLFLLHTRELKDLTSRYVDGDRYASAALHCMCFLSNPPKYAETGSNVSPEVGITYAEWKATCQMALGMLCRLLDRANTSPELVHCLSDHDINPTLRGIFYCTGVDTRIRAFLKPTTYLPARQKIARQRRQ